MKRIFGFLMLGLLVLSMGAMATTKYRNLQIVNSTIQLGASGTTLTGTVGNSGNVQEAGSVTNGAGILCADANGNSATCSAIQVYSVTTESSDTPLTGSSVATVITHAVTMPTTGCPCRVRANWAQYITTSGSAVVAEAWVSDATNNFAEAEWPVDVNNGPSGTGAGLSPVTYANSAVVTFTLKIVVDGSSVTARAAPFHAFGARNSRLELAVISSN